jgi:hypothetical protein
MKLQLGGKGVGEGREYSICFFFLMLEVWKSLLFYAFKWGYRVIFICEKYPFFKGPIYDLIFIIYEQHV